jgi:hypothetical protein
VQPRLLLPVLRRLALGEGGPAGPTKAHLAVVGQGLGKGRGTNSVERPVRPYQSVLIFLLVSGAFLLVQLAPHAPDGEAAPIRLALPDDVLIADFLRALGDATGESVRWSPRCKQIRRNRMIGEMLLEGSKADVLTDVRALLTFYELKMVSRGPAHEQVHLVTTDIHTCGLRSSD